MDERALQAMLFLLLKTSSYLIVLDDVWRTEDWERIKAVFPQGRGWKMILTSRNEGVGLHVDPRCFTFSQRILAPEESWNLLESIVFPRRDEIEFTVDVKLKGVGKKMVTYCGGLPLAIEVLGGLLKKKKYTLYEWNGVYENIGTQVVQSSGVDDKAAEGIITTVSNGTTIRESGEGYIKELVQRNMVIAGKSDLSWRWEYCQMHDMMREVCLSKAKEENFLQVIKSTTSSSSINAHTPTRSRRLVVQGNDALHMLRRKDNKKARSVLCFGLEGNLSKQSAQELRSLQFLRVLDLDEVKFEGGKLPSSIEELIHLRFLSLYLAKVSHLPSSLRNLKRLLYLNLGTYGGTHVPNIFKEMVELRYLSLPSWIKSKAKLELGNLVNLEHLWCFPTEQGNVTDLFRMIRLRSLYIILNGQATSQPLPSSLPELQNLETFHLSYRSPSAQHVDFVWNFIHLRDLQLTLHMPRFPDQSRFPPHLAHISLERCKMEEDPLPILEKLLHLKSVKLVLDAFVGRRMECSTGGFPQLCKLYIWSLIELEEWVVEEGSMPCLCTLKIRNCRKLEELPEGLKYITSLKELEIVFMNKDWKKKLSPGGEIYYKVQHIPSVQFLKCE